MIEDDTHDELVKAFIEYSKANEIWERNRSHRTYFTANRWLREIRRLAKARQLTNKEYFKEHVQDQKRKGNS